jgi:dihydropteroate synthase
MPRKADFVHTTAPMLMGICNVTPDSFSDGGKFIDTDRAVSHVKSMLEQGATAIDIGAESTRPDAAPVTFEEERARLIPVLEHIIPAIHTANAIVSVDTRRAAIMREALDLGVDLVNDVSALTDDPDALSVVANSDALVCLMHKRSLPGQMEKAPHYDDVVAELRDYLAARIDACVAAGIGKDRILIDPGIGFDKTAEHNVALLRNLDVLQNLGVPLLLGASRKRFIAALDRDCAPDDRLGGSIAAVLSAYHQGVRHFRVHDVAQTRQALAVFSRLA